jgi:hypothetical protein
MPVHLSQPQQPPHTITSASSSLTCVLAASPLSHRLPLLTSFTPHVMSHFIPHFMSHISTPTTGPAPLSRQRLRNSRGRWHPAAGGPGLNSPRTQPPPGRPTALPAPATLPCWPPTLHMAKPPAWCTSSWRCFEAAGLEQPGAFRWSSCLIRQCQHG